jgi:hypothetical protein
MLGEKGISYIVSGKSSVDLANAVNRLEEVAFAQEKEEINHFPFRSNSLGCFLRDEHEIVSCRV